MITGSYDRYGHLVTDPFAVQFYVTMMAFGSLVSVGLGIAFAYAAWAEKGVSGQIDAYLKRRRLEAENPAAAVAKLDPLAEIESAGVKQSPDPATNRRMPPLEARS